MGKFKLKRFFVMILIILVAGGVFLAQRMDLLTGLIPKELKEFKLENLKDLLPEKVRKAVFKEKPVEKPEIEVVSEAIPVKAYEIKRTAFKDTLPAMGNIKGVKEVDLKFETSGILESFNINL